MVLGLRFSKFSRSRLLLFARSGRLVPVLEFVPERRGSSSDPGLGRVESGCVYERVERDVEETEEHEEVSEGVEDLTSDHVDEQEIRLDRRPTDDATGHEHDEGLQNRHLAERLQIYDIFVRQRGIY